MSIKDTFTKITRGQRLEGEYAEVENGIGIDPSSIYARKIIKEEIENFLKHKKESFLNSITEKRTQLDELERDFYYHKGKGMINEEEETYLRKQIEAIEKEIEEKVKLEPIVKAIF